MLHKHNGLLDPMMKWLFPLLVLCSPAWAQNAPPVGNQFPVQPAKTGNYTIKNSDLKSIIPMNCSSSCVVTFPASTSSFPKGYPVQIGDIGTAQVTVTPTGPSTIYGVPLTSGNVLMNTTGQFVNITADTANNFYASGVVAPTQGMLITGGSSLMTIGTGLMTN